MGKSLAIVNVYAKDGPYLMGTVTNGVVVSAHHRKRSYILVPNNGRFTITPTKAGRKGRKKS